MWKWFDVSLISFYLTPLNLGSFIEMYGMEKGNQWSYFLWIEMILLISDLLLFILKKCD